MTFSLGKEMCFRSISLCSFEKRADFPLGKLHHEKLHGTNKGPLTTAHVQSSNVSSLYTSVSTQDTIIVKISEKHCKPNYLINQMIQ